MAEKEFVTGGLKIGSQLWSREMGCSGNTHLQDLLKETWPKNATVYIIGIPVVATVHPQDVDHFVQGLPGRKVLICPEWKPGSWEEEVAARGCWYERHTSPLSRTTWGRTVSLGLGATPGTLSFHVDHDLEDGADRVNVDWSLWSGRDPAYPSDWAAFMTPYYLTLYAESLAEGFLIPVGR